MGDADADEDLLRRGKRINNACFDAVVDQLRILFRIYIYMCLLFFIILIHSQSDKH